MDYDENRNDLREWVDKNLYGLDYCLEKVKLISLISEVFERLPSNDRKVLMYKRGVRFISPITNNSITEQIFIDPLSFRNEQNTLCRCSKCNEPHFSSKNGRYDMMVGIWLICLSSDILKKTKKKALYTIAHELAYVYLERRKSESILEELSDFECATEKLMIKWGFKSEPRQKQFNIKHRRQNRQNVYAVGAI